MKRLYLNLLHAYILLPFFLGEVSFLTASEAPKKSAAISRKWLPSLNFHIKKDTSIGDWVDTWHAAHAPIISTALKVFDKEMEDADDRYQAQPNIVIARLSVIYRDFDEKLHIIHYDIPHLFVSGWSSKIRFGETKAEKVAKAWKETINYSPIFLQDVYKGFKNFQEELISTYTTAALKSDNPIITAQLQRLEKYTLPEEVDKFGRIFFHSEEAALGYIKEHLLVRGSLIEVLSKLSKEESITIDTIVLNMVSNRDMCFTCGSTFLAESIGSRLLARFKKTLRNSSIIMPDDAKVLVEVSDLKEYRDESPTSRETEDFKGSKADKEPFAVEDVAPYVAQMPQ